MFTRLCIGSCFKKKILAAKSNQTEILIFTGTSQRSLKWLNSSWTVKSLEVSFLLQSPALCSPLQKFPLGRHSRTLPGSQLQCFCSPEILTRQIDLTSGLASPLLAHYADPPHQSAVLGLPNRQEPVSLPSLCRAVSLPLHLSWLYRGGMVGVGWGTEQWENSPERWGLGIVIHLHGDTSYDLIFTKLDEGGGINLMLQRRKWVSERVINLVRS